MRPSWTETVYQFFSNCHCETYPNLNKINPIIMLYSIVSLFHLVYLTWLGIWFNKFKKDKTESIYYFNIYNNNESSIYKLINHHTPFILNI